MTVISTHHTSLKVYAANTPGVVNASVGFDEATLQPTYELKVGVPGASAGINIAQRLGLNPAIIDSARSRLGTQARDVGQFLDKLHADLREADTERLRLKTREQELENEKAQLAAEGRKEQQVKIREMEKKLESLLRDFEYHAREAVNAIQDRAAAQKLSKDAERRIAKLRREFSEQFDSTVVAHSTGADHGDPHAQPQVVKHVSEGDTVKLKSTGRSAQVVRKVDDNHFEVEMGAMKMKIARDDIAEVLVSAQAAAETPVKAARARGISVSFENEGANVPSEINVIGQTVDEASSKSKSSSTGLPGRTPARPRSPRQRHGHPPQSPEAVAATASPRSVSSRSPPKRRRRRSDAGGVERVVVSRSGIGGVDFLTDLIVLLWQEPYPCHAERRRIGTADPPQSKHPYRHYDSRASKLLRLQHGQLVRYPLHRLHW